MSRPADVVELKSQVRDLVFRCEDAANEMTAEKRYHEETKVRLKSAENRCAVLKNLCDQENTGHEAEVAKLKCELESLISETKQLEMSSIRLMLRRDNGPDPAVVGKALEHVEALYIGEIEQLRKEVETWKKKAEGKAKKAALRPPDSIPTVVDSSLFVPACESMDVGPLSNHEASGAGGTPEVVRRPSVKRKAVSSKEASLAAVHDGNPESSNEEPPTPMNIKNRLRNKQVNREKNETLTANTVATRQTTKP